jgi:hypothetical protein
MRWEDPEFEDSQGYITRPCLKKQNKPPKKQTGKSEKKTLETLAS